MRKFFCAMLAVLLIMTAVPSLGATATQDEKGNWEVSYTLYLEVFKPFPSWEDVTKDEETQCRFAALLIRDAAAGLQKSVFDPDSITSVYITKMAGFPMAIVYTPGHYYWLSPYYGYLSVVTGDNGMDPDRLHRMMGSYFSDTRKLDSAKLAEAMAWKVRTVANVLQEEGYEGIFRSASSCYTPSCGWISFNKGDVSGFVNAAGEYLTDNWNDTNPFNKDTGLAVVYRGEMNISGNISYPKTDSVTHRTLGDYGLINTAGAYVLPLEYESIYSMGEGLYKLRRHDGTCEIYDAATGGSSRISGYDYITDACSDGTIRVFNGKLSEYGSPAEGVYGMVDLAGQVVVPLEYEAMGFSWHDGLINVKKNGKYGLLNRSGKLVVPCTWDSIGDISGGTAIASRDNLEYLIDTGSGAILHAFGTKYAGRVGDGYYYCPDFENHMGLLDANLEQLLAPEWYDIASMGGSLLRLGKKIDSSSKRYGIYDLSTGKFLVQTVYDTITIKAYDGLRRVEQLGYYGYMDESFRLVIPAAYTDATDFGDGCAAVQENGRWEIIDTSGNILY